MSIRNLRDDGDESYFEWLCAVVKSPDEYKNVLRSLYYKTFYSLVPNDDNRAIDAVALRDVYIATNESHLSEKVIRRPATFLEMLVGLADRMAYTESDFDDNNNLNGSKYFWMLIENMRLVPNGVKNNGNMERVLKRMYAPDGTGGLFPLKKPPEDQRKVEIWYQMMYWLHEKETEDG